MNCCSIQAGGNPELSAPRPIRSASECWFCLRAHPKHEHIAAAQLRQEGEIEVFLPRIRYRRPTRLGLVWVTEALFRDYLFARFDLQKMLRRVRHARGVSGVVHFGEHWPAVPDEIIEQLRALMHGQELRVIQDSIQPGDQVQIGAGPMCGLEAVVTRVMSSKQRVAVLLDFLGRQTSIEVDQCQLAFMTDQQTQRVRGPLWATAQDLAPVSV